MTTPRTAPNHKDLVTLRELLEAKLEAIQNTMTAKDREIELRLEAMNELREQINSERGKYITRTECDTAHTMVDKDVRDLRESRAELRGKASMTSVIGGYVLAGLSLIIAISSLVASLIK